MSTSLTKVKSVKAESIIDIDKVFTLANVPNVIVEDRSVNMSNLLSRGYQGLKLSQKRLIAIALGYTDSYDPKGKIIAQNMGGWRIRVTAQEYARLCKIDPTTAYDQLKESASSLLKQTWKVSAKSTSNGRGQNTKIDGMEGSWIIFAQYAPGEGFIDIVFSPIIAPHLLSLSKSFTSYNLGIALNFRSNYTWRMYDNLMSWRSTGLWAIDIEDFYTAVDAIESSYKDFGNLRKRVIEPSIKEIHEKTDLLINWSMIRRGRKVTGLRFDFCEQGKILPSEEEGVQVQNDKIIEDVVAH